LRFDEIETGVFTLEFSAQTRGKRQSFASVQSRKIDAPPQARVDATNALRKQEPFDAIDVCGPFPHQPLTFSMRTARIFFFNGGNANDRTYMPVAPMDSRERSHKHQDIDPVSFDAARPAIDLKTSRIENLTVDSLGLERSRQPKTIITSLIADQQTFASLGRCSQFQDQIRKSSPSDPVNARLIFAWVHHSDNPAFLVT
jgi:hypothetical protein